MEKLGKMLISMTADEIASKLLHEQKLDEKIVEAPVAVELPAEVPQGQSKKVKLYS